MTDLRPFRALRYDTRRTLLDRVIVPPYDVVTPEERELYWQRDAHNAIRLELTRDVSAEARADYTDVAKRIAEWRDAGVLVQDDAPGLYALRQRFQGPDGLELVREGFFALLRLEDYARGIVRPHERTLSGPKADRLKQLRATRANLSSIFFLYEDREHGLARALRPAFEAEASVASARDDAGVEHSIARIAAPETVERVRGFLSGRPVVIADGHHRYETALAYRDERRAAEPDAGPDAPFEWTLGYFANAFAPGSLLRPIHRVVRKGPAPTEAAWRERLTGWQQRTLPAVAPEALERLLAERLAPLAPAPAFVADDGSERMRLFWKESAEPLDLAIRALHREVIEGVFGLDQEAVQGGAVAFAKSATEAAREVRAGRGAVALYVNPLTPEDVFRVTGAGELLPQKSTLFVPKLPSGLVFRLLERRP